MLVPTNLATKKWSGEFFAKNSPDHFLSPAQAHGLGDKPDQPRAGPAALDIPVEEIRRTDLGFGEGRQRIEVLQPQVLDEPVSRVESSGGPGESIAFGLGVTMPAIMILGFDLEIVRVMLVEEAKVED